MVCWSSCSIMFFTPSPNWITLPFMTVFKLIWEITFLLTCFIITTYFNLLWNKGSSLNDVAILWGRGKIFCDVSTYAFVMNCLTMDGVSNDVIHGRPLIKLTQTVKNRVYVHSEYRSTILATQTLSRNITFLAIKMQVIDIF